MSHLHIPTHNNQSLIPSTSSTLQQTLQQIQTRVSFFSSHNLSAQNGLIPNNNQTVRSISQIITPLKYYHMAQTPLNLNLAPIYLNQQNRHQIKWAIPPPSQGEDSINQQQIFQPSFKWLSSSFIDSHLLEIDSIQPRKVEKGKVAQQWKGITQIILINIKQKIYLKQQIKQIQNTIKRKFQKYSWLRFKRAKQVYYRGKPSIILKFNDQNSASFVYFNFLSWKSNRQQFGQDCQVYRVVKNNLKQYNLFKNWIILIFRRLPINMTKEQLLTIVSSSGEVQIKWMDDLIQIQGYLDQALLICSIFNNKKIRQAKVNIHPRSSKNWKAQQINLGLSIDQEHH